MTRPLGHDCRGGARTEEILRAAHKDHQIFQVLSWHGDAELAAAKYAAVDREAEKRGEIEDDIIMDKTWEEGGGGFTSSVSHQEPHVRRARGFARRVGIAFYNAKKM